MPSVLTTALCKISDVCLLRTRGPGLKSCHLFTLLFIGSELEDRKHLQDVLLQEVLACRSMPTEQSVERLVLRSEC